MEFAVVAHSTGNKQRKLVPLKGDKLFDGV